MTSNSFKQWLRGDNDRRLSFVALNEWGLTIADCRRQVQIELDSGWPLCPDDGNYDPKMDKKHLPKHIDDTESDIRALTLLANAAAAARMQQIERLRELKRLKEQ